MDKTELLNNLKLQEKELEGRLMATRDLISLIHGSELPAAIENIFINSGIQLKKKKTKVFYTPEKFDKQMSYTKKIAFILNKKNGITGDQILAELMKLEKGLNPIKAKNTVNTYASQMIKRGIITGVRNGRKYVYNLVK
ncbi:MAG: hypothetical protein ACK4K0_03040 [Flavobacteriales bacterium]